MKTPKDSACTFLSDRALRALVKELPTPFYLYDEAGLRQTVRELHDAFGWNCGYRQYFPVRLCVLPAILRMLADEGCGAYCDNAAELALAKRCGFPGERILCAGFAGDEGSPVVLDGAFDQPPAPPKRVLLRLNPGGKLTYDGQSFASLDRFCLGMPPEEAHMLARQFRLFGTEEIGLLFQALTNELHPGYAPAVAQLLFEAVCAFSDALGFAPDVCCLGDCLAASDRSGTSGSSLSGSGAEIRRLYEQLLVPKGLGSVRLSTTLGRRQVAPHAVFVSRVRAVRQRQKRLVLLDAACSQLADAGPVACRHHIRVLSKPAAGGCSPCDIVGRTSEPFGYLAMGRSLPDVSAGDILVFQAAGVMPERSLYEPAAQYLLREDGSVVPLDLPDTAALTAL